MKKYIIYFLLLILLGFVWTTKIKRAPVTVNSVTETSPEVKSEVYSVPVGLPARLVIPKLNINTVVEQVTTDASGRMDVPKEDLNVGWWSKGVLPGQQGNSVMAGHFDRKDGSPAVFYELGQLRKGDEIQVIDANDTSKTFRVVRTERFKDREFPLELVFGANSEKYLNLITCDGVFDKNAKNYSDRLVVFAKLEE